MNKHPGVFALQKGCDALQMPMSAAQELVRFLIVKRICQAEKSDMIQCSSLLEKLLCWMLLDTDTRDAVEGLVGKIWHVQGISCAGSQMESR